MILQNCVRLYVVIISCFGGSNFWIRLVVIVMGIGFVQRENSVLITLSLSFSSG